MSFHTTSIDQLVSEQQILDLHEIANIAMQTLENGRGGDLPMVMSVMLRVAMGRVANPGLPEDIARFRSTAQLFERVVASGTTHGVEADIADLATVLIGLG